ncbi:magnesium and cobalt transport protein CorA [Aquihabitans sp. G128]|uniref:magnesium and cobalt transport protein CorA n=1 Tax=Aquihabitans sp. G128 TaxID=2849779 RepID=UPI001C23DF6F|nr:magnesium and cobalt transport protein CorA [Aquihabitans sp. G128]QXC59812.1 magnesium and cobalt transport protein CorA [Aquihabitans sp. G128]
MIVDCGVYRSGRREGHTELADAAETAAAGGGFAWIGLHDPSMDEIDAVAAEFGFHELLVEDVCKAHQRAKFEHYADDVSFVVLKTARYAGPDSVAIGEIQVVLGPNFVVTVRHGDATPLKPVRQRLEAQPDLLARGPAAVLYGVADQLVDDYAPVIQELELDVDEAEQSVFSDARENPAERIFGLKRQVLDLLRNVLPVVDVLDDLQEPDAAHPELHAYFRDVADHLRRVIGRAELVRDLLTDALNANLAQVSVRQNDDMRTISGWAALIAAPTLLAGIWGMNFTHMPELDWWVGYPVALGLMALVVVVLYRRFRQSGWL